MARPGLRGWPDTACFPGRSQALDKGLKTGRFELRWLEAEASLRKRSACRE